MIPWGANRPDVLGPNSGVCSIASGVVPIRIGTGQGGAALIGYGPAAALTVPGGATALSAAPRGSISLVTHDGNNQLYFATASTIAIMSAAYGFTNIATGLTVTSGDDMNMRHFGSYLLGTNTTDGLGAYNVETPAGYAAVSGAPATPRNLEVCGNSVFLFDVEGNNKRMANSAIGDHTNWTTQGADGKTFEDGGALMGGIDLGNGRMIILQRDTVRYLEFGAAGDLALYGITKIADGVGSVGYRSHAKAAGIGFWLSGVGFQMFNPAISSLPINIGAEAVNNYFFSQVDASRLDEVQATVDPEHTLVLWRFFTSGNSSTSVSDMIIGYHYTLGCWFIWPVNCSWLTEIKTPGYTLEDMDAFGTLEDILIPLDDRFWQGGERVLAGLDSSYIPAVFSGTPMAATIQGCAHLQDPRRTINELTQITDDTACQVTINRQEMLGAGDSWTVPFTRSARSGRTKTRATGRLLTFKSTHAAGATWTHDSGLDFPKEGGQGE